MLAMAALLVALIAGCLLAFRYGGLDSLTPRWGAWLLLLGSGATAGIGITSTIFFLCRLAAPASPSLPYVCEAALLVWLVYACATKKREELAPAAAAGFPWNWLLAILLLCVLAIGTAGMAETWDANPQGNWDAWSIWNLRAKFLASPGDLASRAWSAQLKETHSEYPLLISGFVARCWTYGNEISETVPMVTSYVFFLSLIAIVTGGIAILRGGALGLLCGLFLAGTPSLLVEVPSQYADIPLTAYYAAALLFLLLDKPVVAGVFASFAVWTKEEGYLFLLVLFGMMALWRRSRMLQVAIGALPLFLLALVFKLGIANASSIVSVSNHGIASRLFAPDRYVSVLGSFFGQFWNMHLGFYHPIMPLLVLAYFVRFKRHNLPDAKFTGAIFALLTAGYFMVYIITPNDLAWQLQTSLNRIFVQAWALLVLSGFLALTPLEDFATIIDVEPVKAKRKGKG